MYLSTGTRRLSGRRLGQRVTCFRPAPSLDHDKYQVFQDNNHAIVLRQFAFDICCPRPNCNALEAKFCKAHLNFYA